MTTAVEDGGRLHPLVLIHVMAGASNPVAEQLRVMLADWITDWLEGC